MRLVSNSACTARTTLKLRDNTVQFSYFGRISIILTLIQTPFFPTCSSFIPLEKYQVGLNLPCGFLTDMAWTPTTSVSLRRPVSSSFLHQIRFFFCRIFPLSLEMNPHLWFSQSGWELAWNRWLRWCLFCRIFDESYRATYLPLVTLINEPRHDFHVQPTILCHLSLPTYASSDFFLWLITSRHMSQSYASTWGLLMRPHY